MIIGVDQRSKVKINMLDQRSNLKNQIQVKNSKTEVKGIIPD